MAARRCAFPGPCGSLVRPFSASDGALAAFVGGVLLLALAPGLPEGPLWPMAPPLLLLLWRRRPAGLLAFVLGLAWACLHGQALLKQRLPVACDGRWSGITGVIEDLPQRRRLADGSWQQRATLRVEQMASAGCRGPERVALAYYGDQRLQPGERWRFVVRLKLPWGEANPGSSNRQDYFARERIDATASARRDSAERLAPAGIRAPGERARAALLHALAQRLEGRRALGVLAALLVGDRSRLSSEDWSLLRALGVVHLVVISGLHVSLVAGAGFFVAGLLARCAVLAGWGGAWEWLRPPAALGAAVAYAALAGFSLPTQRALAMLLCLCLALLFGRRVRSARNLLLAVLGILVVNPLAAVGSSFWLSFLAVAWLLWFAGRRRGRSRWATALLVHGFMALAMAPLTSWWFGGVSLVSAPANLLLVPLVGLLLVPLVLIGALLWPGFPRLGGGCWELAASLLDPLLAAGHGLQARAGDLLYLGTAGGSFESLSAVAGVLLLFGTVRLRWRLAGVVALLPLLLPSASRPALEPELTVLDVGQGTAVVYRSGERTLVYDTGGGDPAGANAARRVVLPFLRRAGVRRIDHLVVSHPDRDHSAGTAAMLEALPVAAFSYGRPLPGIRTGQPCRAGVSWRWPDGSLFRFLSPAPGERLDRNDSSCVLLIEVRGHRFLLTGDVDRDRERELVRYWREALRADWLLVAHHGSASSTAAAFLRAVRPRQAAFTFGRANAFGHPAAEVLERLCRRGVRLRGTAHSGALRYRAAADGTLRLERHRSQGRRYWRQAPALTPLDCSAYNRNVPGEGE